MDTQRDVIWRRLGFPCSTDQTDAEAESAAGNEYLVVQVFTILQDHPIANLPLLTKSATRFNASRYLWSTCPGERSQSAIARCNAIANV